jgi:hypothetical protein
VGHLINSDSTLVNDRDFLNSLFVYSDGDLFWKKTNKKAGSIAPSEYVNIAIDHIKLKLHRIVYVMHNGPIPDGYQIHHKDGDKKNNRIGNLECVSALKHASLKHIHKKVITFNKVNQNWQCLKRYNNVKYIFTSKSKSGVSRIVNSFLDCIMSEDSVERFSKYMIHPKKRIDHWSHSFEQTQESLNKYFTYQDGTLYRKHNMKRVIGTFKREYMVTCIGRKQYTLHRLIYIYHYGAIPDNLVIDHIDHNKLNNDISNLRAVSNSVNALNGYKTKIEYLNKSKHNKWAVRVKSRGKVFYKSFSIDQKQEAIEFRKQMLAVREDYDALRELYGYSD